MVQLHAPVPLLAAAVAVFAELPVALAIAVGAFVRPSAVLMFLYTLGTALIGHRYWTTTGAARVDSMDSFYKKCQHHGCCTLLVRENLLSMDCSVTLRHNPWSVGPTMQRHVAQSRKH
jgi:putative oxidoreductase